MEKRVPMAVPVDLVIAEEMFVTERAITVNVSPHGARVVTRRRWQAEEQPWVASPMRAPSRPLGSRYFA